jgi:hypothetical protein
MRRRLLLSAAVFIAVAPLHADVEELFSRYVRVFKPQGDFAKVLTAANPPAASWQEVSGAELPLQIRVPPKSTVDAAAAGSRVLQVVLPGESAPKAILRVDRFQPQEGEPTAVDADYVEEYAAEYPKQAFGGKFTVTEQGLVALGKKLRFAMVGGSYPRGAVEMNRLQWAYLSKGQQLFITFDCAAADWDHHSETLARILLSVTLKGSS